MQTIALGIIAVALSCIASVTVIAAVYLRRTDVDDAIGCLVRIQDELSKISAELGNIVYQLRELDKSINDVQYDTHELLKELSER